MRTRIEVEELFRRLYRDSGNDPAHLIQVKAMDGGWEDALSYELTRSDRKRTRVYRRDLDDDNEEAIKTALRSFA